MEERRKLDNEEVGGDSDEEEAELTGKYLCQCFDRDLKTVSHFDISTRW